MEQEPADSLQHRPPNWPAGGAILFRNVNLAYSTSQNPVLKNVSFEIKEKEKVSITKFR